MSERKGIDEYANEKWGYYLEGLHESINPENCMIGT